MASPVDICNLALDGMGTQATIQGLDPPAPPGRTAEVAARNYQTQVDAVLRSANWNCTRGQQDLVLVRAAIGTPENPSGALPSPPIPYLYEYAYPPDCLKLRFVIPRRRPEGNSVVPQMTGTAFGYHRYAITSIPFVPNSSQDAQGNDIRTVLTDARNAIGVYTKRITNPDLWDPELKTAIIATLAACFVIPLSLDKALMAQKITLAVNMIKQARIDDGNEGITSADHIPDWMQIRNAGGYQYGGVDGGGYGFWNGGWDQMSFPDGASY